ncbi:EpsG family protein [Stutzerimonas stutzeri]|uniref:EpsG family protein n=1 Tax=Stutzerimonas stutzeri TaxID=316 RepID=UPI003B7651A4
MTFGFAKGLIFFFIFAVLVVIAGLRPIGLDRDSENYVQILHVAVSDANLLEKEPAFWLINEVNNRFVGGSASTFFLLFSLVGVYVKLHAINKLSKFFYLSLLLYISFYFILHEMTQIRVGVAAGFFLLAVRDYFKGKLLCYFLNVFLACLFHYSAVLCFALLFIRRKGFNPVFYCLLPFLSFCFGVLFDVSILRALATFLPEFLSFKILLYIDLLSEDRHSDINVFNFYYASIAFLYLFFVLNYRKIADPFDLFMLKVLGFGISFFFMLSFLPVLAFRVSEFFLVVMIVLLADLALLFKQRVIYFTLIGMWALAYFVTQGIMKNLNLEVLF